MGTDISPELLRQIQAYFTQNLEDSKTAAYLAEVLEAGAATYVQAGEFACEVGQALADAFAACLSSDILPDGKMYWNVAENVISPMLGNDHELVSNYAVQVQENMNQSAGLGLKAQTAPLNTDRINGILNKLCAAEQYDAVAWLLGEPIINFSQNVVDETLRRNVEFQSDAGLKPRVIRRAESGACKWCRALAGSYDYPDDVPDDLYRRHENCRCIVEYNPGDGRRQDVWTKQWR